MHYAVRVRSFLVLSMRVEIHGYTLVLTESLKQSLHVTICIGTSYLEVRSSSSPYLVKFASQTPIPSSIDPQFRNPISDPPRAFYTQNSKPTPSTYPPSRRH
jgi:hypothetical protein